MRIKLYSTLILSLIILGLFARGGSTEVSDSLIKRLTCTNNQWVNSVFYSNDVNGCPDLIAYVVSPAYVSEPTAELVLRMIPMPVGKYGLNLTNSGLVMSPYSVDIDSTNSIRIRNLNNGITKGVTLKAKMSTTNTLFFYPLDRYSGEINFRSVDEISKSGIPGLFSIRPESLSGWKLKFSEPLAGSPETNGKAVYGSVATLEWKLARANIVYFSVLLLLALLVIALVSAIVITRSIARGIRPPSMNLLLWLATVLFATLQVRGNFPGNPAIGILVDYVVVFPVLSALLVLGILNTYFWTKRWDWDLENVAQTQN